MHPAPFRSSSFAAGKPLFAMTPDSAPVPHPLADDRDGKRFEVRSVTGACYTLVEEQDVDGAVGKGPRRYRTAYAGLPVVANDDGSFTIVDTHTRLVRVGFG